MNASKELIKLVENNFFEQTAKKDKILSEENSEIKESELNDSRNDLNYNTIEQNIIKIKKKNPILTKQNTLNNFKVRDFIVGDCIKYNNSSKEIFSLKKNMLNSQIFNNENKCSTL